jgi:hypothetical protein
MGGILWINGINVPCEVTSGKRGRDQIGESVRAIDGTLRIHRRVLKERVTFKATPQDVDVAIALRQLILGEGHNWSFDDATKGLYSGKGLGPSASSGAALNAAAAFLGARGLRLTATTGTITFKALPPLGTFPSSPTFQGWTVGCFRNAGAWHHYITTSEGLLWTDGVVGAGAMPGLTVNTAAGTVKIDAAGVTTDIDELFILPYNLPYSLQGTADDWGPQIYAQLANYGTTAQWPPLARLGVYGPAMFPISPIDEGQGMLQVAGELKEGSILWGRRSAFWGPGALQEFEFELKEV